MWFRGNNVDADLSALFSSLPLPSFERMKG